MTAFRVATGNVGQSLISALFSPVNGLSISNITYSGSVGQAGFYDGSFDSLGIASGIILTTGSAALSDTNTSTSFSTALGTPGDDDVTNAARIVYPSAVTYDANSIVFHLFVSSDQIHSITMNAVFGSEEYPIYVGSSYTDTAVVLVNGVNYALVDNDPNQPLSVNSADIGFHNSTQGEYNGVTAPLSITAPVNQGDNIIKIAIADAGDDVLDSGVIISNLRPGGTGGTGITLPNAPAAPMNLQLDRSTDGGVVGDAVTNVAQVLIDGNADAGSTVNLFDGTSLLGSATTDGNGFFQIQASTLSEGQHALTATAAAAGGTSVPSEVYNLIIDTTPPTAAASTSVSGLTNQTSDTISGNASDLNGVSSVHVFDGSTDLGNADLDASGNYSFVASNLSDGTHAFSARAVDHAGNIATVSAGSVQVDTTAPKISDTVGVSGSIYKISGTASDASGLAGVHIFDNGQDLGAVRLDQYGNFSLIVSDPARAVHDFSAVATDLIGNIATTPSM